jgi:serine/threonine protein kinase
MRPLGAGREIAPGVRVVAHLARSNHLDVYDAWCERRACRVVAKTLRPDRRGERRHAQALVREGRLLRRLSHPHLVRAYEVHDGDRPVVVLETLGGQTLAHLVATSRRPLGAAELRHLGLHLGSALHYLHGHGVLHLDLKPSNVVAEAGRAKVIDLSVARGPGRMSPGRGTWCTMAPEQARGGHVGPAADVWGLGIVLWEAATGDNPFAEPGERVEYPQLEAHVPPLRAQRPRLDPRLAGVVDACLRPDPAARPALGEVLDRLAG